MNPRIDDLREKARKLALLPGVYLMKDASGKIIYIGKAKALKNRVSSYFRQNANHDEKVRKMVSHVHDFDFIVTASEFEALVLECSLIKQYEPKYNILLKDDKGYHYIGVGTGEYPRITFEMQKNDPEKRYLGPYTSSFSVKQAVEEANRVFRLPTCKRRFPQEIGKGRPCLNYHIRRCMGVCMGVISGEDYRALVNNAVSYMQSGSEQSVEALTREMDMAAEQLDFERAARLRDQIGAIRKVTAKQRVIGEGKDFDLVGASVNGAQSCVSVIKYREGRLVDKEDYFFTDSADGQALREEFLLRYYGSRPKEEIPREVWVDEEGEDAPLIERYLRERAEHAVTLLSPKRGERLKLVTMAAANASEALSLRVGRTGKEIAALEELGKLLGLPAPPQYIEAYDISNLAGTGVVAGMIVFENGRPKKSAYKRFTIKTVEGQDDYASMAEVLRRRFTRYRDGDEDEGFSRLPDLLLLDGGKGHVGVIEPLLREMGIETPVFGMVKDDKHRTRAIALSGDEIAIASHRRAFTLVSSMQEEVHRFAIAFQRGTRTRTYGLVLTEFPGIGPKRAEGLLKTFRTKAALLAATPEELRAAAKLGEQAAVDFHTFLHEKLGGD